MSKYYIRVVTADADNREIVFMQSDDPMLLIKAYDAIAFDKDGNCIMDDVAKADTETQTNIPLSIWFDDPRFDD